VKGIGSGLSVAASAIAINLVLALVKISVGVLGSSYALIADGIESTADIFSSLVVYGGLQVSSRPPDEDHPYGHGKAESLAAMLVSLFLIGSAILIAVQSIAEIRTQHSSPAWYTLLVISLIILIKELLFRRMYKIGDTLDSSSLRSDAWHHRSDAITSLAAFVGISIAVLGGDRFASADDWAALLACGVILFNGLRLLRPALNEVMDAAPADEVERRITDLAANVPGVARIEKCRIRKSGLGYLMDIHVEVDSEITVREGHAIGHEVKDRLLASDLTITDVVVHVEPVWEKEVPPR
jgi:cation diffusion facilitator family transporter